MTNTTFVRSGTQCLRLIIALTSLILLGISCTPTRTVAKWVNWNIVFNSATDSAQRASELARIKRFIVDSGTSYIQSDTTYNGYKFTIDSNSIKTDYCFCDPFLQTVSADLTIIGSGGVQQTPPGGIPKPTGGDLIDTITNNNDVNPPPENSVLDLSQRLKEMVRPNSVNDSFILAIIDTGIDTTLFEQPGITRILWQGEGEFSQLRNFVQNTSDRNSFMDDDRVKHGSAVAAVALQALKTADGLFPRLMILKAFDANRNSSIFSVSCATKYAIQHHASLINASWGYYGRAEYVLPNSIALGAGNGNRPAVPFIAAAGNDTTMHHTADLLCTIKFNNYDNTFLGELRWFYPACFTPTTSNVISVTNLLDSLHQCFYQNFSPNLISLGVINTGEHPCCSYHVGYLPQQRVMEGSSFATPVVSGKIIAFMLHHGLRRTMAEYIDGIGVHHPTPGSIPRFTLGGQYLLY